MRTPSAILHAMATPWPAVSMSVKVGVAMRVNCRRFCSPSNFSIRVKGGFGRRERTANEPDANGMQCHSTYTHTHSLSHRNREKSPACVRPSSKTRKTSEKSGHNIELCALLAGGRCIGMHNAESFCIELKTPKSKFVFESNAIIEVYNMNGNLR